MCNDQSQIKHEVHAVYMSLCLSNVFKLTPLDIAWSHGQVWVLAFQRLNARHFIGTFNALALFG